MILISAEGGTKTQRRIGDQAIRFFIKKLMPRKRSLSIELKIHNLIKDDMVGSCQHIEGNEVLIESHHRGTLYDYITFLAHECIHMKQFVRGELKFENGKDIWNGEDLTGLAYRKQPWEMEAWKGQHSLAKDFIKSEMNMTLKKAKQISPRSLKEMNWNSETAFLLKVIEAQEEHA